MLGLENAVTFHRASSVEYEFGGNKLSEHEMATSDLEFFNSVSGELQIELSVPAQPASPTLLNLLAAPEARVVNLKLTPGVYDESNNEFRDLTPHEFNSIAFRGSEIRLRNYSGRIVAHKAPNGALFSVRELLLAVEETERQTRDSTELLGGVDVHHVYFGGIEEADDGVWDIIWDS